MNTKTGTSLGLALIMAAGILAVLFALGTFTPKQAGAHPHDLASYVSAHSVTVSPMTRVPAVDTHDPNPDQVLVLDVKFTPNRDLEATATDDPGDTIRVTIEGVDLGGEESGQLPTVILNPDDTDPDNIGVTIVEGVETNVMDTTEGALQTFVIDITFTDADNTDDDESPTPAPKDFPAGTPITIRVTPNTDPGNPEKATMIRAAVREDADDSGEYSAWIGWGVQLQVHPATPGAKTLTKVKVLSGPPAVADNEEEPERIRVGSTLSIDMGSFGVPSSIDADDVLVRGIGATAAAGQFANAAAVSVYGKRIDVTVPDMSDAADLQNLSAYYEVIFTLEAGITVPAEAGSHSVVATLPLPDPSAVFLPPYYAAKVKSNGIKVGSGLLLSKSSGATGTDVTVTGVALANGTARLSTRAFNDLNSNGELDEGEDLNLNGILDDGEDTNGNGVLDEERVGAPKPLKDVEISGGTFETTVAIGDLKAGHTTGHNQLIIEDATGAKEYAVFQVTGTMAVSPMSVNKGERVKVSLSNWIDRHIIRSVTVAGQPARVITNQSREPITIPNPNTGGSASFYVKIDAALGLGTKSLALHSDADGTAANKVASTNIEITSLGLTLTPATAVPGQIITAEGHDFASSNSVHKMEVGGKKVMTLGNGSPFTPGPNINANVQTTTNGRVAVSFRVPMVVDGEQTVVIEDASGRVAYAPLTILKPTIILDPISSLRGTTVTVTGTGFPANQAVNVNYNATGGFTTGKTLGITSARTDNTGAWIAPFRVPNNAPIGKTHPVEAKTTTGSMEYSAEATHSVPAEKLTLNPSTTRSGNYIEVIGMGFPAYHPVFIEVSNLTVGNVANTDGNGDFTANILVPALPAGRHLVKTTVNFEVATQILVVSDTAIVLPPRSPEEAYSSLISNGNLIAVWHFNNEDQTWSFYDPRPEFAEANTYTEINSGDTVWLYVKNEAPFQSDMLYPGLNNIAMD